MGHLMTNGHNMTINLFSVKFMVNFVYLFALIHIRALVLTQRYFIRLCYLHRGGYI
jgi:hypothetical protein